MVSLKLVMDNFSLQHQPSILRILRNLQHCDCENETECEF